VGLDLPWAHDTFPPASISDRRYVWDSLMGMALHEASHALGHDDVPVGALVISPDGRLLGTGHNRREETGDPTAHAEVLAIRQAAMTVNAARRRAFDDPKVTRFPTSGTDCAVEWRLTDCTLVVTLEPCVMCAGALLAARITRLVIGAWDPKAGATGSVWDLVRDSTATHTIEVVGGIREKECADLLTSFFQQRR
jgi:tRNA(adenine34) deaminase